MIGVAQVLRHSQDAGDPSSWGAAASAAGHFRVLARQLTPPASHGRLAVSLSPGSVARHDGHVRVVVATMILLSFISFWRAAAIVLNDLGSTAFYIGGIVEQAVGKA